MGTKKPREIEVLYSTAIALTIPCKVHNVPKGKSCFTKWVGTSIVCAKRRAKFPITEPGKVVTVTI